MDPNLLSALIGALASLFGAAVGGWFTLKAARESLEKQHERERFLEHERVLNRFDAFRFAVASPANGPVTYEFAVKLRDVMFENKWLLGPEANLNFFNSYLIGLPDVKPEWSEQYLAKMKERAREIVVPS